MTGPHRFYLLTSHFMGLLWLEAAHIARYDLLYFFNLSDRFLHVVINQFPKRRHFKHHAALTEPQSLNCSCNTLISAIEAAERITYSITVQLFWHTVTLENNCIISYEPENLLFSNVFRCVSLWLSTTMWSLHGVFSILGTHSSTLYLGTSVQNRAM